MDKIAKHITDTYRTESDTTELGKLRFNIIDSLAYPKKNEKKKILS